MVATNAAGTTTGADTTSRAQKDITALLRDRHHVAPGDDDDFSIRNLSEIADARQFIEATALVRPVAFAERQHLHLGDAILHLPGRLRRALTHHNEQRI